MSKKTLPFNTECFEQIEDFVFCKGVDSSYLYGNPAFLDFFGFDQTMIAGCDDTRLFGKEAAKALQELDKVTLKEGEPQILAFWFDGKEGIRRLIEIKTQLIRKKSKVLAILCFGRDMTRLHQYHEVNTLANFFVDNMADIVRWIDEEGKIEYVNKEWGHITGYTQEETLGHYKWEFDALHTKEEILEILHQTRSKEQYVYETEFRLRNGTQFPFEVSVRYVKLEGKGHFLSIARNISMRKQREYKIEKLTKVYNESQKVANIGSWEWNSLSEECIWSDELYEIFEIEKGGRTPCAEAVMELVYPDDVGVLKSIFDSEYKDRERREVEFRIINTRNSIKILRASFRADVDESDVVTLVGTVQDVTKFKKQENLIASIFNSTEVGICVTDVKGDFVQVNRKYGDLHGFKPDELIGESFFNLVAQSIRANTRKKYEEYMLGLYDLAPIELRVEHKEGYTFYVLATFSKIYNELGETFNIMTVTDITQQLKVEERQQEQEQMLIQQSKMASMGEMIGAIAHQWRQPLSTITMMAGNLVHAYELEKMDSQYIANASRTIIDNARYMSEAIDTFKKFYRVDTEKRVFGIVQAIEAVLYILKPQMAVNFIDVNFFDHTQGEINSFGYENIFKQAVTNLLLNSRDAIVEKAATQTHLEGTIDIDVSAEKYYVQILIRDNGIGIPNHMRDKMFLPYKTSKGISGTGIGLYITKLIIEDKIGGTISVVSYENPTVFKLMLPRVR